MVNRYLTEIIIYLNKYIVYLNKYIVLLKHACATIHRTTVDVLIFVSTAVYFKTMCLRTVSPQPTQVPNAVIAISHIGWLNFCDLLYCTLQEKC